MCAQQCGGAANNSEFCDVFFFELLEPRSAVRCPAVPPPRTPPQPFSRTHTHTHTPLAKALHGPRSPKPTLGNQPAFLAASAGAKRYVRFTSLLRRSTGGPAACTQSTLVHHHCCGACHGFCTSCQGTWINDTTRRHSPQHVEETTVFRLSLDTSSMHVTIYTGTL